MRKQRQRSRWGTGSAVRRDAFGSWEGGWAAVTWSAALFEPALFGLNRAMTGFPSRPGHGRQTPSASGGRRLASRPGPRPACRSARSPARRPGRWSPSRSRLTPSGWASAKPSAEFRPYSAGRPKRSIARGGEGGGQATVGSEAIGPNTAALARSSRHRPGSPRPSLRPGRDPGRPSPDRGWAEPTATEQTQRISLGKTGRADRIHQQDPNRPARPPDCRPLDTHVQVQKMGSFT
jgi:hypothetical protein